MNKQELIEALEELKENAKRSMEISKYKDFWQGKTEAYVNTVGLAKQLDEPQKPVVPKFVADWFEENKDDLDYSIWEHILGRSNEKDPSQFHHWFGNLSNNPIEILIHMKDGYEVEKEPLYRVKLGEGYFVEYQGRAR